MNSLSFSPNPYLSFTCLTFFYFLLFFIFLMNRYPEPRGRNPKHPCRVCSRTIAKTHRKVRCKTCNYRIHIKCNLTDPDSYDSLPEGKVVPLCRICAEACFPFQTLEDKNFWAATDTCLPFQTLGDEDFWDTLDVPGGPRPVLTGDLPNPSCGSCSRKIPKNHRKLFCRTCGEFIHIKCNKTDPCEYDSLPENKEIPLCRTCTETCLPFQALGDSEFYATLDLPWDPDLAPVEDLPNPPCRSCKRKIPKNHRKLLCKTCNEVIHIKCNKTDPSTFDKLARKEVHLCLKCAEETIPFQALDEEEFTASVVRGVLTDIGNLSLDLPSESMKKLVIWVVESVRMMVTTPSTANMLTLSHSSTNRKKINCLFFT